MVINKLMSALRSFKTESDTGVRLKSATYGEEILHLINFVAFAGSARGAIALYRKCSAVSIPVRMIANNVSMITPTLLNAEDETEAEQPEAIALLKKLKNPSSGVSSDLFFKSLAIFHNLAGYSMVLATGSLDAPPAQLEIMNPAKTTITFKGNGSSINSITVTNSEFDGIYVAERDGFRTRYIRDPVTELGLIRGFSSANTSIGSIGESPLLGVGPEIDQVVDGAIHNSNLLRNGGTLSLLFGIEGDPSDKQFTDAESAILTQFSGVHAAGRLMVVPTKDITVKEMGITPKDLDFEKLQKMARKIIALQYSVPPTLVDNEKSTFNNLSTSNEMLFDNACAPLIGELLSGLEFFLFPRYGLDPEEFDLKFDETKLPILRERFLRELKTRKDIGIETINELRTLLPREPVDEGGDVVYQSATLIPLGTSVIDTNTEVMDDNTADGDNVDDDVNEPATDTDTDDATTDADD